MRGTDIKHIKHNYGYHVQASEESGINLQFNRLVPKSCIIQNQTFFFARLKPNQSLRPLSLHRLSVAPPPLRPSLTQISFSGHISTGLWLSLNSVQCSCRFSRLTNMDRRPKWFLKSSNGLWSACAVLGDNSRSVSHSQCCCVCLCLRACASLTPAHTHKQTGWLGYGSTGRSGGLGMR